MKLVSKADKMAFNGADAHAKISNDNITIPRLRPIENIFPADKIAST